MHKLEPEPELQAKAKANCKAKAKAKVTLRVSISLRYGMHACMHACTGCSIPGVVLPYTLIDYQQWHVRLI